MLVKEYTIKAGDNYYLLAGRYGCVCQDFIYANPGIDPNNLKIGQKIRIPGGSWVKTGQGSATGQGYACAGGQVNSKRCDDVLMEVDGVKFRVTRQGEPTVPHELHFVLPRTEIHKIEHPQTGIIETTIMLSNINVVNSPRREAGK